MNNQTIDVSIVIPIKDEAENIVSLAAEITTALEASAWRWECVWVDDGSSDNSLAVLEALQRRDNRQRYISFQGNSGQSAAFFAGFRSARGRVLATIDGDGQNDPADLPAMVARIMDGKTDMVNGYRQRRQDTGIRKIASRIGNGTRNAITGKTVRDVGCSTRAFRRECADALPQFAGMHRFLPTLVKMQGFRLDEIPVNHRPRMFGTSKYNINNRLWVGLFDLFGVKWLQKRGFTYSVARRSSKVKN